MLELWEIIRYLHECISSLKVLKLMKDIIEEIEFHLILMDDTVGMIEKIVTFYR